MRLQELPQPRRLVVRLLLAAASIILAAAIALVPGTADAAPPDPNWCSTGDPVICRCVPGGQIVGPDGDCPETPTTTTTTTSTPTSTVPPPTTILVCAPGEIVAGDPADPDACLIPPVSITRPAPPAAPVALAPGFTG